MHRSSPRVVLTEAEMFAGIEQLIAEKKVNDSWCFGGGGPEFREVPESGALLVGFELTTETYRQRTAITSIRPLFRGRQGIFEGRLHGKLYGRPTRVEAKPGYAVGGLFVHSGDGLNGMEITFMRVDGGLLDPTDRYTTARYGEFYPDGSDTREVIPRDTFVIGIHGKAAPEGNHMGLGLVTVPAMLRGPRSLEPADEPAFFARIAQKLDDIQAQDSPTIGGAEQVTREMSPQPGVLVGYEFVIGKVVKANAILAARPIFRTQAGLVDGAWSSEPAGRRVRVVAPPGYAVGELKGSRRHPLESLIIRFMRLTKVGLDPDDFYETEEVMGDESGFDPLRVNREGALIVGCHGMRPTSRDGVGVALGLVTISRDDFMKPVKDSTATFVNPAEPKPASPKSTAELPPDGPLPPDLTLLKPLPAPSPVETALLAHIAQEVAHRGFIKSQVWGTGNATFEELPKSGAWLVGLEITVLQFAKSKRISSVRPIFRTRHGIVVGSVHGRPTGAPIRIEAKPGYVVGGVYMRAGGAVDGLEVTFMRFEGGKLDIDDRYTTAQFGDFSKQLGSDIHLVPKNSLVVGIHGAGASTDDFSGLGVMSIPIDLKPGVPPSPADEAALFAHIDKAVKDGKVQTSHIVGFPSSAENLLPERPGLLIGFVVSIDQRGDREQVGAIQPIYRTKSGDLEAPWLGEPRGRSVRVVAKPGYAVAGVTAHSGITIDAMQVKFMRIGKLRLDPTDEYDSEMIGGKPTSEANTIGGDGSLIVGIHGVDLNEIRCGFGLVTIP